MIFHLEYLERWIVCTPLSVNVFITLATKWHMEYHCKAFMSHSLLPSPPPPEKNMEGNGYGLMWSINYVSASKD
jgi:hypothetical protein